MMATAMSQKYSCSLVEDGTLELETKGQPIYTGVVVTKDMLLVTDDNECNLQLYSLRDGKLISKSHRLKYRPIGVCLISMTEVAVGLWNDSVIPAEVLKMDTRSLQMYKMALNEGKEKVYNIRIMVVGQYGVGKTTLTQHLLGNNVNISERHSTEGIDVHVECCKVSLPAGEWTIQEKNAEQYSRLQRLVKLLNERAQKQESKSEQERQSELDDHVTREKHDNRLLQHDQPVSEEHDKGHPQHDPPVSAKPYTSQEGLSPPSRPSELPNERVGPEASSRIKFKENEKDTVMEILQLVNENSGKLEKSTMEYAALALWDFAGQYVFYTTHQTFLTSRAVYLLVIDLSQQVTDLIKDDECFLDTEGIKLCKVHGKKNMFKFKGDGCRGQEKQVPKMPVKTC